MAVTMKSTNGLGAIKKIGIPQSLYDWLAESGLDVKLHATAFKFYKPGMLDPLATVPVTLSTLQALSAGTIGAMDKLKLGQQLAETVSQLHATIESAKATVIHEDGETGALGGTVQVDFSEPHKITTPKAKPASGQGALDKLAQQLVAEGPAPNAGKKAEPTVVQAAGWPTFPIAEMTTAETVKLRDATQMYQPVDGTSHNSRYYLVGGNADLRVAARLQGHTLSVRVEGPTWEKHASELAACGFTTINKGKGYASLHLEVGPDPVLANKTMGAVLLGMGVPLETPLPNLSVLKGK